jgi:predicted enzyme related to lactoylglutathione lyase
MISHIDHLVLTVSDIERAVAFYSSVLNSIWRPLPSVRGAGR